MCSLPRPSSRTSWERRCFPSCQCNISKLYTIARVVRLPLKSCMIRHGFRIHDDSPSQPPPPLFEDFVGEEMLSFRSAQLPRPCRQHHRQTASRHRAIGHYPSGTSPWPRGTSASSSRPRRGRAGEGETLALPRPGEMRPCFGTRREGERETRKAAHRATRTKLSCQPSLRLVPASACDILSQCRHIAIHGSRVRGQACPRNELFRKVQADQKQAATMSMQIASDQMRASKKPAPAFASGNRLS
jgi:hypothetical protein